MRSENARHVLRLVRRLRADLTRRKTRSVRSSARGAVLLASRDHTHLNLRMLGLECSEPHPIHDARRKIAAWRVEYNCERPHSALKMADRPFRRCGYYARHRSL